MIIIKCNKCDKIHQFQDEDLDYEMVDSSERSMGIEKEYLGTIEIDCDGEVNSKACDNHLTAEFNFWEYPGGAFNLSECNTENCTVEQEPDYQNYINAQQN